MISRALVLLLSLTACVSRLGGAFTHEPEQLADGLSPKSRAVLGRALAGLDPTRRADYHTHVVGVGAGGTGATVNEAVHSWLHPLRHLRYSIYVSAAGVRDETRADAEYIERLVRLVRHSPAGGRHLLLPFDRVHDAQGRPLPEDTDFHTPNDYVFALARAHPDIFAAGMSIHPYRPDAIAELERYAAQGGRVLKWLPNSMRIDPQDPRLTPFYDRMRELGVALLSHAGHERAVEAGEAQELGNPLRLRAPLRRGVKVILAHCASDGQSHDLDRDGAPLEDNVTLFLRLMDEPAWRGLLFGEVSAVTLSTRYRNILPALFARPDLHERLVDGSDYPIPAVNVVVRTGSLHDDGYLDEAEREALNEIYDYNPLLFDLALKRTLHGPKGERLPPSVFHEHAALPLR